FQFGCGRTRPLQLHRLDRPAGRQQLQCVGHLQSLMRGDAPSTATVPKPNRWLEIAAIWPENASGMAAGLTIKSGWASRVAVSFAAVILLALQAGFAGAQTSQFFS